MTLDELYVTLPNGFHDAEIKRTVLDYENGTASLTLDMFVGAVDAKPSERELYRLAELTLEGLAFWIIEPPSSNYLSWYPGPVRIDIHGAEHIPLAIRELPVPAGSFLNTIYVFYWNSFIYLAAQNARFTWLADASLRD
ncbi:hypothetical protein [Pleomorphomonas sp. PLEO]|uniref:hypothetical protein n=1 Tax=Pleomorphomonas sp. PLEO TaxID=3239306 RepID=UPI00351EB48F